ncbi:MAG TPA: GrpB family protein, partial [Trueperaceae bacterium]
MADALNFRPYDPAWPARFAQEKARLLGALGELTEGGWVENIQHIGSTSVPGLAAKACIDILMAAWPLPLPAEAVAQLEGLGYRYHGENGIPGREYFTRGPHDVHLHVTTGDSDLWVEHLLFRDYLRANPEAARTYQQRKRELARDFDQHRDRYQEGKAPVIAKLLHEARQWYRDHVGFGPVQEAARELAAFSRPWYVASGWALDLYLGHVSRVHH